MLLREDIRTNIQEAIYEAIIDRLEELNYKLNM